MNLVRDEPADSTLRWGALAGVLGSLLMLFVFGFVAVFVGMEEVSAEQAVERFPDIRAARTVENGLYLLVLLLWAVHVLGLYRELHRTSPAPALFGAVLSILGLGVLAAGALPHVATAPISDLFHAPGATPQGRATLVVQWEATQGMFDALLVTGLVILPIGLLALGTAMTGAPGFGRRIGGTTVVLGVLGLAAATAILIDVSPVGAVGLLVLIAFHLILGWRTHRTLGSKTHRLARTPRSSIAVDA
jgi:hypothetical protein